MAYRIVSDHAGNTWQVWAVRPAPRTGALAAAVAPEYQQGWLAFERTDATSGLQAATPELAGVSARPLEKRRLAPIPPSWEEASEATLLGLLAGAAPVTSAASRARPSAGTDGAPTPRR